MLRSVHTYVNVAGKTDSRAGAGDAHGGRAEVWMARACTQAGAEDHAACRDQLQFNMGYIDDHCQKFVQCINYQILYKQAF